MVERRVRVHGAVLALGLSGCNGCRNIDIIDPDPDTLDSEPPGESGLGVDTDPEPPPAPCAVPEVEPNDRADIATPLPMERRGCGTFLTEFDGDFWDFELKEEGWLAVDLDGILIGSEARLSLTLSSSGGVRLASSAWRGWPEAHLVFPATPDRFSALVRQAVGEAGANGAGEDFFYEVRASSTKPPVSWDVGEVADNGSRAAPQRLLSGAGDVRVFGGIDDAADQDWYELLLPGSRFRVEAEVIAHDEGSPGNFAIEIWRGDARYGSVASGRIGIEYDPWFSYDSLEPEALRLRVIEEDGEGGAPFWYLLVLHVEET